jgi:hypothetical protein
MLAGSSVGQVHPGISNVDTGAACCAPAVHRSLPAPVMKLMHTTCQVVCSFWPPNMCWPDGFLKKTVVCVGTGSELSEQVAFGNLRQRIATVALQAIPAVLCSKLPIWRGYTRSKMSYRLSQLPIS